MCNNHVINSNDTLVTVALDSFKHELERLGVGRDFNVALHPVIPLKT